MFIRYEKKTIELPISARPRKKTLAPRKTLDQIPSSIQRTAGIVTFFLNLHSFADICARFADICARFALRILLAPFEISATDHLGGPTSPVLGKTLEAAKSVHLPFFGDDPWFGNTFGLRAEI